MHLKTNVLKERRLQINRKPTLFFPILSKKPDAAGYRKILTNLTPAYCLAVWRKAKNPQSPDTLQGFSFGQSPHYNKFLRLVHLLAPVGCYKHPEHINAGIEQCPSTVAPIPPDGWNIKP